MQQEYFDQLMQAMLQQQQVWEQLKEENRQLRRQLTNLRAAQGVLLIIEGKRFRLTEEADENTPTTDPVAVSVAPLQPAVPTPESAAQGEEQADARLPGREEIRSNTGAFQKRRLTPLPPSSAQQQIPTLQDTQAGLQRELAGSFLLD
jgi:hypothetical protein